jgi:hypothetical protein
MYSFVWIRADSWLYFRDCDYSAEVPAAISSTKTTRARIDRILATLTEQT